MTPKRGDLVYMQFHPQSSHEQGGHRPAIVLSPEKFNQKIGFTTVCPITSQKKGYPFEVDLPEDCFFTGTILTDQMKSLDWRSRQIDIRDKAPEDITQKCIKNIHKILPINPGDL